MPSTYTPIASQTLTGNALTVTFSSIPQTYTDLILVTIEKQTGSRGSSGIQFNSDLTSNYSMTQLYTSGSTALSRRYSTDSIYYNFGVNADTSNFNAFTTMHIMDYTDSTIYKTVLASAGNTQIGNSLTVGLWNSTAAITSLRLWMDNLSNFTSGCTFTLYGIKAA